MQAAVGIATWIAVFRYRLYDIDIEPPAATGLSTLLVAALFQPLRRRLLDFIGWRFYRRRYNARQLLSRFAARLRDQVDKQEVIDRGITA